MVIPREPRVILNNLRGLRRDYTRSPQISKAYIVGALHDATERKTTFRISQKSKEFVQLIAKGIVCLGGNAWIYKEGANRNVYIVEFSKSFLGDFELKSLKDKRDYIRGYFDTDGGVAKSAKVRFYIYFCQKDYHDLEQVRNYLFDFGINCGAIHNPSRKVDPNYWRFFVSTKSHNDFVEIIGSWHPDKKRYLRMKI